MRRTGTYRGLALLAVVAVATVGCGGGEGDGAGTIEIQGQNANDHGSADVSGDATTEFEMDDFYFSPTVLEGEAGQTITLEAFNEGGTAHTFTIPDGEVDQELEPEGRLEIDVTFPDSGVLAFECRFHAGQGMRGALSIGPLEESGSGADPQAPAGGESPAGGDGGGYGY